jgi:hypothetical protein
MNDSEKRSISVLTWTIGTGAALWYFFGAVPGVIGAVLMFGMCQIGAPRDLA